MGTTNGDCGTTLCCSSCPAIPVVRVIDGDAFVTSGNQSLRLFGVDTPERGEPCSVEATERFKELAGDSVRIEYGPRHTDRYGRLLAYVYTEDAESIAEKLIRAASGRIGGAGAGGAEGWEWVSVEPDSSQWHTG